jgi:hypothetical protein
MGSVVLVGLVLAWAVVLVPAVLRRRAERGSSNSIGDFRERLALLHARHGDGSVPLRPVGSYATLHPAARRATASVARAKARRAQKRRRDVFFGLLASIVGSAGLALVPGFRVLWALNLTLDILFVAYALLLVRIRNGGSLAPVESWAEEALPASYEYAYGRASGQ